MDHVERLCTPAAILHQGRLVARGSIAELRKRFGEDRRLEEVCVEITSTAKRP